LDYQNAEAQLSKNARFPFSLTQQVPDGKQFRSDLAKREALVIVIGRLGGFVLLLKIFFGSSNCELLLVKQIFDL
jgi:hypothetical protein